LCGRRRHRTSASTPVFVDHSIPLEAELHFARNAGRQHHYPMMAPDRPSWVEVSSKLSTVTEPVVVGGNASEVRYRPSFGAFAAVKSEIRRMMTDLEDCPSSPGTRLIHSARRS
jgi:hypothetical protein